MGALFCYESQYGDGRKPPICFPDSRRSASAWRAIARFYGNLIGVKYGEPFVVKETMRVGRHHHERRALGCVRRSALR